MVSANSRKRRTSACLRGVYATGSTEHCQTTPQHRALSLSNIELFNRIGRVPPFASSRVGWRSPTFPCARAASCHTPEDTASDQHCAAHTAGSLVGKGRANVVDPWPVKTSVLRGFSGLSPVIACAKMAASREPGVLGRQRDPDLSRPVIPGRTHASSRVVRWASPWIEVVVGKSTEPTRIASCAPSGRCG